MAHRKSGFSQHLLCCRGFRLSGTEQAHRRAIQGRSRQTAAKHKRSVCVMPTVQRLLVVSGVCTAINECSRRPIGAHSGLRHRSTPQISGFPCTPNGEKEKHCALFAVCVVHTKKMRLLQQMQCPGSRNARCCDDLQRGSVSSTIIDAEYFYIDVFKKNF